MSDNSYLRSRPVPIPTTPAYDGARPLHGGWNGQKPRGTKAQTSSSYMYVVFGLLIVFGVIGLAYSFTSSSPPEPVPNIVMKTDMDGFELALHHYESNPNLLLYFVAGREYSPAIFCPTGRRSPLIASSHWCCGTDKTLSLALLTQRIRPTRRNLGAPTATW